MTTIAPVHPGEIPDGGVPGAAAGQPEPARGRLGVPPRRINEVVHGKRRISANTALRLARYLGTTDRFWLNLQVRFDLVVEEDHLGSTLEGIEPLKAAV